MKPAPQPRIVALLILACLIMPAANARNACSELAQLVLTDTRITLAERLDAGEFRPPGVSQPLEIPAICRIAGTVPPAIRFEVWLPEGRAWNGRFQGVGGGGLAGVISYAALAEAVRGGYASASTDTGHAALDSGWLGDRQRVIDYGYRAVHAMTTRAKAVIAAHYGRAPAYAYFNGCSTGGRQGLMEAQRYPADYDGIVAGAPVNDFTHLHIGQLWAAHATLKQPGAVLTANDLAKVSQAVIAACDASDGVKDGILADPRTCRFDPSSLQMASAQIEALRMIYRGAVNPRTGAQIYPGLEPGGEGAQPNNPGWSLIMNGHEPFSIAQAVIGGMGFESPGWDWRSFDFDTDIALVDAKLYGVLNAIDPDLRDFKARGGKLIMYHGWNDPGVMPQRTVAYLDSLIDFAGKATGSDGDKFTDEYLRLFMMPGMGHCRGGSGPDQADFIAAVRDWVELGEAPASIVAHREQNLAMTRPLCPYPQVAHYRGAGDTSDARNFACTQPR